MPPDIIFAIWLVVNIWVDRGDPLRHVDVGGPAIKWEGSMAECRSYAEHLAEIKTHKIKAVTAYCVGL